jgi:hypothetical protein
VKDHIPPAYIAKMSEQIQTLQARIAVRLTIAKQDAQAGDTWAMRRNLSEAASMEAMLHDKINSTNERKEKQK